MEAFEKWADKEDEDPRPYGSEEWARECGWREAFKTIRSKFNTMGVDQIISFIDWELEDEKR